MNTQGKLTRIAVSDRRRLLGTLLAGAVVAAVRPACADDAAIVPDYLMTPVRQRYAALASYSDTGSVETNYQWPDTPASIERHRFTTAFRAPRNFFFRFDGDPAAGGDIFVIWCDGGDFQSWWKSTGVHEVYDGGRGSLAFSLGASPTKDAANIVPSFIFPQAEMKGVVSNLLDIKEAGEEAVGGKRCRKLSASGRETGIGPDERPIVVWIDSELGLVRQVRTEAQTGSAAGLIDRATFVLDPIADPPLADDRFTFQPPA